MRLSGKPWQRKEEQVSDEKWAYAFFFATLLLGVALLFDWADVRKIKKQAIERGHAEYVVDSDGKTTWQWKEAK